MNPNTAEHDPPSGGPQPAGRRPARWLWLAGAGVVVVAAFAAVSVWARVSAPKLQGAVINPPAPTYDFRLQDQDNHSVQLSTFRGKAVVLTFLYTHCPDACPLTAEKLHDTYERLGEGARRTTFIAVSVDPQGDTPEAVRVFLSAHHVERELTYLTGPFTDLKRVWAYYNVASDAKEAKPLPAAGTPASPTLVGHSSIVYVIDPSGHLRVILPGNFDPKDLAADLKILAGGPAR